MSDPQGAVDPQTGSDTHLTEPADVPLVFYHPEPERDLRFECALSLPLPELLPLAARSQLDGPRDGFRLNPRFHCQRQAAEGLTERMRAISYSERLPVCWVPHPLYAYPEAYWPDPACLALIDRLATGEINVESLDAGSFALLTLSHALVLDDEIYTEQMHALSHHWRQRLAHEQYLHLPQLISPLQVAALRAYTRQRRLCGPLQYEDDPYVQRYFRVHDPVVNFLHQHVAKVLRSLISETLRSSYNVISYYHDTALAPHCDREPCIWNVSLQLDSQPASAEAAPWPLFLKTRHGELPVLLQAGDALIYPGREMEHWRHHLPPERQETVLLFHFVDEYYTGRLY